METWKYGLMNVYVTLQHPPVLATTWERSKQSYECTFIILSLSTKKRAGFKGLAEWVKLSKFGHFEHYIIKVSLRAAIKSQT